MKGWVYFPALLVYSAAMKQIPLTRGKSALVDDADFEWLSQWKWHLGGCGYARRQQRQPDGKQKTILMHREICPQYKMIDHRDGDGINNQRDNLREATQAQNNMNRRSTAGSSSRFKGVYLDTKSGKWRAKISVNNIEKNIGYFSCEVDAALAYNKAAIDKHGEFSRLNII